MTVTVKKVETGTGKSLKGGEFTIYAYNTSTGKYDTKVSTSNNLGQAFTNPLVTADDGTAISEELYYTSKNLGKFVIQETKAPAEHDNRKEKKYFVIKSGNKVTQDTQTLTYTFDDPGKNTLHDIRLIKEDSETGTPVYDAEFSISVYKNSKNGEYYTYGSVPDRVQADMEWAETKTVEQLKDADGNLTNTYQTEELAPGRTYMITETKRPVGYSTDGGVWGLGHGAAETLIHLSDLDKYGVNHIVVFTLQDDGTIEIINSLGNTVETQSSDEPIVVSNSQSAGSITVKKVDDKTDTPLSGASFELWEVTREQYDTDGYIPSAENGDTLTGSGETDEDGIFVFGQLVNEGEDENGPIVHRENGTVLTGHYYLLVETKAPEGYRLPDNTVTKVHIGADEAKWTSSSMADAFEKTYTIGNEKATLDLNIHKVSTSRTGKESVALPGAEFALYKVEKIVTDNGALSDDQKELEDANDNGIDDGTETAIGNDTVITDRSDVGADSEEGNTVDYSVLSNENYIDFDYSTITPLVDKITTDDNGNAVVPEALEAGAYVLVETKAPKNYLKADPQYIYIDTTTLYSSTSYEIEVKDEEFEAMVRAVKVDADTGKTVEQAGVGFKVKNLDTGNYVVQTIDTYSEPEVEGAPHELIKSEETDTFYTDGTGTVTLPGVLPVGHYQLEEISAPKGYVLNTEPIEFTIDDEMDYYPDDDNKQFDYDENTRDVIITVTCEDEPTKVEISKKDMTDQEELPGAELKVWYTDSTGIKKVVEEWTSTDRPHMIKGLEIGKEYTLTETVPADGYVTAADVKFTVRDTAEVQKVVMVDDITKVQITKSDITTGDPVKGATLQIIDSNGKVVEQWITSDEPYYIEKLPVGDYTLRETKAPTEDGYVKAEDIGFAVKDTGEIQKVDMADDYTKVKISKTDITGTEEIEGAGLKIVDSEGNTVAQWTTDGRPYYIEKLPVGDYTLIEETAPDGYVTAEDIRFTVEDTGKIQKVVMKDDTTKIELTKLASDTKKLLAGAEFKVYDSKGTEVYSFTTDSENAVMIEGILKAGETYTFVEVSAPKDYEKAADVKIIVKDTGKVQKLTITDKRKPGKITTDTPDDFHEDSGLFGGLSPRTGDVFNCLKWLMMVIVSGTGAVVAYVRYRRNRDEKVSE